MESVSIFVSENKEMLMNINKEVKDHCGGIESALNKKIRFELGDHGVDFINLKLYSCFDLFEPCDCFFTGIFRYNNEQYEVVFNDRLNSVALINKNGKKDFTTLYKILCKELVDVGEVLFFDKINYLIERDQKLVNKTEVLPTSS